MLVGAHFGGFMHWDEATEKLAGYENFAVDTSSTSFLTGAWGMRDCINAYGSERCMFGTDYPMNPMAQDIQYLLYLNYSDSDCRKIFADNAKRIYRLR